MNLSTQRRARTVPVPEERIRPIRRRAHERRGSGGINYAKGDASTQPSNIMISFFAQAINTPPPPEDWNWPVIGLIALAIIVAGLGIAVYAKRRDGMYRERPGHAGPPGSRGPYGTSGAAEADREPPDDLPRTKF